MIFRVTFEHMHYVDIEADDHVEKGPHHHRFINADGSLVTAYRDGEILSVDQIEPSPPQP